MARLKINKRYALAVILIRQQHSKALDDVANLYIKMLRSMEASAQAALHKYILEHQKQIDALIAKFRDVLVAYDQETEKLTKLQAIGSVLGDDALRRKQLLPLHVEQLPAKACVAFQLPGYIGFAIDVQ